MLDLHNHMLPGLDDGARDWEESLGMARLMVRDGITGVVCTPHHVPGAFENSRSSILAAVGELRRRLGEQSIPLAVYPGAELRLDSDLPEEIQAGRLLSINDTRAYALIELPGEIVPQNLEDYFWELQMQGITPVLGHPERNFVFHKHPERLFDLVRMGVLVQLTSSSLFGRFGSAIKKFSTLIVKHRMAHVLATDAHGMNTRAPRLYEGYKAVEAIAGMEVAVKMVREFPHRIVFGEPVTPYETIPLRKKRSFHFPALRRFLGMSS